MQRVVHEMPVSMYHPHVKPPQNDEKRSGCYTILSFSCSTRFISPVSSHHVRLLPHPAPVSCPPSSSHHHQAPLELSIGRVVGFVQTIGDTYLLFRRKKIY